MQTSATYGDRPRPFKQVNDFRRHCGRDSILLTLAEALTAS